MSRRPRSAGVSVEAKFDLVVVANFLALGIQLAAVPRYLHDELHATRTQTGTATTIYFVAALLVRPLIGALVDRIGRRPFIMIPPTITAGLSLLYTQAHSVLSIAVLRFLAGGLAALFFTSVALAVTDLVPPERRTQALGRQSVMTYGGFTVGPVIAERLIGISWTAVWVTVASLQVLTTLLATRIPETRPESRGAPARPGFDRRVVRPALAVTVANFSFACIVSFVPEYAERLDITRPGILLGTYAVAVLAIRWLTGPIADRIGPARFVVPALFVGSIALAALATAQHPWQSYVAIAFVGASLGATFPAATAAALLRAGTGDRGKSMGTVLALGDIGQASAGPLVGYLSTQLGFRWVYGLPAIAAAVVLSTIATLPEVRRRPARP